jgi:uncharacterized membrane protein YphA (DoxX/SURF4 family)
MGAPNRAGNVLAWVLQIVLAALFLLVGSAKLGAGSEMWVQVFAAIGIGQWFRVFTGSLEILCAILLLIPRGTVIGAALLSCTMVAAFFIRLFVLRGPTLDAITPLIYLVLLVLVVWLRRDRLPWRART